MRILQIIDSLAIGGAEKMAISYANELLKYDEIKGSYLCATRSEGDLIKQLDKQVDYVFLGRQSTFDLKAILKLRSFILKNKIQIIQAHSTSFFIATVIKALLPNKVTLIWHDHYGNSTYLEQRPFKALKLASTFFDQIFTVNSDLAHWSRKKLKFKKVLCINNFVANPAEINQDIQISGTPGFRIVCLANLRPQKNHQGLLDAFSIVVRDFPESTLHLFGKSFNDEYSNKILHILKTTDLKENIFYHGEVENVRSFLPHFNIGVLASSSEGLPLALLEYGFAGLTVVATDVGEVRKVLQDNGIIIQTGKADLFAKAIIKIFNDKEYAKALGRNYREHVNKEYLADHVLPEVIKIYESIIR
ncbi:glycosyltransferase [Leeuwenhoekiella sp. A16]|uniref:glycosyltransferase n=1 Tax=Leeuwenhoekiella sp. A16 TaxID=3141462 RepID=UPI003A80C63C